MSGVKLGCVNLKAEHQINNGSHRFFSLKVGMTVKVSISSELYVHGQYLKS